MGRLDLAGSWRAAPADEDLRRAYPDPAFRDDAWHELPVPGHWQSDDAFADEQGPMLHRRRFSAEPPGPGRRAWLRFDGVFYQSDLWLDGRYLGDTEGYFAPHAFDVTELLRARSDHVLAAEVTCAPQPDPDAKRNLTGLFQDWDLLPLRWNPGGIWRAVAIEETGSVRIASLRVRCTDATEETATVEFHAVLDAEHATGAELWSSVAGADVSADHQLAAGRNELAWTVVVGRPALWWPHALGDQALVDVRAEVRVEGVVSDERTSRTGLRQVTLDGSVFSVNGERVFLKGANQGPTRLRLADATPDEIEQDVVLAQRADLDLLRVHGHVGRPELYDAADRHGVLLWQDLPLVGGYARGVRKIAAAQARRAVELLGHHPSIAMWCAHADPPVTAALLGGSVRRALERADGTRPVVGEADPVPKTIAAAAARIPRTVRFVSGLGAGPEPGGAAPAFLHVQIETLRRLKYRPTRGFLQALFAAPLDAPAATAALDRRRAPGAVYEALAAACAPVVVVADPPEPAYRPGARVRLDVHVVSDLREALEGAIVTAEVAGGPDPAGWRWVGDVPPDACVRVGQVDFTAAQPGDLRLQLTLEHERAKSSRTYFFVVGDPGR